MFKAKRIHRHKKVRKNIFGNEDRPRVAIFRSTQHIYAQIIDDMQHKTLVSESDLKIKAGNKTSKAIQVGEALAKKAIAKKNKSGCV
jgi:large subunit ribosomal protein L18